MRHSPVYWLTYHGCLRMIRAHYNLYVGILRVVFRRANHFILKEGPSMLKHFLYMFSMKNIYHLNNRFLLDIIRARMCFFIEHKFVNFVISIFFCLSVLVFSYPLWVLAADAQVVKQAKNYYQKGKFCSSASVKKLAFIDKHIIVTLDIDEDWAETLDKEASIRDRWFAIHCPASIQIFWSELNKNHDIIIESKLPKYGAYSLSCRKFEEDRRRLSKIRKENMAEWAARIWRRLGLASKETNIEP